MELRCLQGDGDKALFEKITDESGVNRAADRVAVFHHRLERGEMAAGQRWPKGPKVSGVVFGEPCRNPGGQHRHHDRVAKEFSERDRLLRSQGMPGTTEPDHLLRRDRDDFELRRGPDGRDVGDEKIQFAMPQALGELREVIDVNGNVQFWMPRQQAPDRRPDDALRHERSGADGEFPGDEIAKEIRLVLEIVKVEEGLAGLVEQQAAEVGEFEFRATVKELVAKPVFHSLDAFGHGRLAEVDLPRGFLKIPGFRHSHEVPQVARLDRSHNLGLSPHDKKCQAVNSSSRHAAALERRKALPAHEASNPT